MTALEPIQQFEKFVSQSKNILILLPQNPDGDAIGSGWAFYFFLKKKNIPADIAFVDEFNEQKRFAFLPSPEGIKDNIYGVQDFILLFNTKHNDILKIQTERQEGEFRIYVTPEKGGIDPRDFSFVPAQFRYDLVVVLGSPDKESLGRIFEESPDIFYEVPIVNIDCHNGNDGFGQMNFVNVTASSTSEVLAGVLEQLDQNALDESIANYLLAGLISATDSFQKKNTTPKSLQLAAKLMELGADQQLISRYLYKTQPLGLLKLWGRIMVKINWDEKLSLVWSVASVDDFVQSRTTFHDLPAVLEKIKDNYSSGKIFLVFFQEKPGLIKVVARFVQPELLRSFAAVFPGQVMRDTFIFNIAKDNLDMATQEVIEHLRSITG